MVKITKEAALSYHETGRPGKIERLTNKTLSHTNGSEPCLFSWRGIPMS